MIEEGFVGHLQPLHARTGRRVAVTALHAHHVVLELGQADLLAQARDGEGQGAGDRHQRQQHAQARAAGAPTQAHRHHYQQRQQRQPDPAAAAEHDGHTAGHHAHDHPGPALVRPAEHQQHHQHQHDVGQHDRIGTQVGAWRAAGHLQDRQHHGAEQAGQRPAPQPANVRPQGTHPQGDPRDHHEPGAVVDVAQSLFEQIDREQGRFEVAYRITLSGRPASPRARHR